LPAVVLVGVCALSTPGAQAGAISGAFAVLLWDTLAIDTGSGSLDYTNPRGSVSAHVLTDSDDVFSDDFILGWTDGNADAFAPNTSANAWTGDQLGPGIDNEVAASTDSIGEGTPNTSSVSFASASRWVDFTYAGSVASSVSFALDYMIEASATKEFASDSASATADVGMKVRNDRSGVERSETDEVSIEILTPAGTGHDWTSGTLTVSMVLVPGDTGRFEAFASADSEARGTIPIPSPIALMLCGFIGLGFARLRR
jgi:hypothetical protein